MKVIVSNREDSEVSYLELLEEKSLQTPGSAWKLHNVLTGALPIGPTS